MNGVDQIFLQIQKRYSVTYFNSTRFFPAKIRDEVRVLYAFLRYPDEVVDNPEAGASPTAIRGRLDSIRDQVKSRWFSYNSAVNAEQLKLLLGKSGHFSLIPFEDLILYKFVKLAKLRNFEFSWVEAFFDSMEMDLKVNRYRTFAELEKYVFGSAEVVGLMMNRIMKAGEIKELDDLKESDEAAAKLGAAMQLTNFLRDIAEDFQRGRIYFPTEDFDKFNLTEKDFQIADDKAFLQFINYQINRIKAYYQSVFDRPELIPKSSRIPVLTAAYVYYDVLERIAKQPQKLWSHNFKKTLASFPLAIIKARRLAKKV